MSHFPEEAQEQVRPVAEIICVCGHHEPVIPMHQQCLYPHPVRALTSCGSLTARCLNGVVPLLVFQSSIVAIVCVTVIIAAA